MQVLQNHLILKYLLSLLMYVHKARKALATLCSVVVFQENIIRSHTVPPTNIIAQDQTYKMDTVVMLHGMLNHNSVFHSAYTDNDQIHLFQESSECTQVLSSMSRILEQKSVGVSFSSPAPAQLTAVGRVCWGVRGRRTEGVPNTEGKTPNPLLKCPHSLLGEAPTAPFAPK